MKEIMVKLTLTFILLCLFLPAGNLWAGDSESFAVRCTIPAIPGVNAPLIEEETMAAPASFQDQNQQTAQVQTITKSEQDAQVTVKTIYER
jgi:hypothetical protein